MKSCEYCGKETANPKFCSLSCAAKSQPRTSKYPYMKKCAGCEQDFEVCCSTDSVKKFCTRSCSASYYNRQRYYTQSCGFCETKTKNKKYCCNPCMHKDRRRKRISALQNGADVVWHNRTDRDFLLSLQSGLCAICSCIGEHNGLELKFILDHIDGNSEHNKKENLRFVCPNCDSQLPTYKAKNRGKGRHARRARYAEGKSY